MLVTAATFVGKLRPGVPGLKLKQSSEAAGSSYFLPLAYINLITVVAATGLYAALFVPHIGLQQVVYNYVVCGSQILFIWFCNWVSRDTALVSPTEKCLQICASYLLRQLLAYVKITDA